MLKNISDYYRNYPAPGLITPVDALYIVFSDLKFAIERSRKGEFYNNNRLEDEKKMSEENITQDLWNFSVHDSYKEVPENKKMEDVEWKNFVINLDKEKKGDTLNHA